MNQQMLAGLPQLFMFVRYFFEENIHDDNIFCRPLTERTTGSDMFRAVNDCITSEKFWSNCVGICTDGVRTFTEHNRGFQVEVRHVAPQVNFIL
jgi:hypothetical protein